MCRILAIAVSKCATEDMELAIAPFTVQVLLVLQVFTCGPTQLSQYTKKIVDNLNP
jgi:hypothetical protein